MLEECDTLRQETALLHQKTRMTINLQEHEHQIKRLTNNNKQLTEKLDSDNYECKKHIRHMDHELDELKIKLNKRDLDISQAECENKVLRKMIRKYEELVHSLRMTVSTA